MHEATNGGEQMSEYSLFRFPTLRNGRALAHPHACLLCDLVCPLCHVGHRAWNAMKTALAASRNTPLDCSAGAGAENRQQSRWAEFNTAANAYLCHIGAGVVPYAYEHIPPAFQQQQHCPICQKTTTWLVLVDYHAGTMLLVCGPCSTRHACERAGLVWKLERGISDKNAWIFQRMRQWITEDGCHSSQLEEHLEGWQRGFNAHTEPAWNHCREARGILVADVAAPYRPAQ